MRTRPSFAALAIGLMPIIASAEASATEAHTVLVLSDTDMVPTVYETGELGPPDAEHNDMLSIITSPQSGTPQVTQMEISNSTYGPPGALDISPNGDFAFVAETFRPRPEGATRLDELPQGDTIRSVKLDREQPTIIDSVRVGAQPQAIEVSPSGDLIVAITVDADRELAFVSLDGGHFGTVTSFGLNLEPSTGFIPLKSTWVRWHPSGRYIAVNLVDRNQVAFYEVIRTQNGAVSEIRPWGNRVQTNKFPFVGCFSPDGRYYVTSDLQWGIDTEGFYGVREGILTTVRLADVGTSGDAARHTVPHIAVSGWGAETIAFSPDGRFLVTSNLRGTGKPDGSPDWTKEASLSLYEISSETGRLTHHGEWPVSGVLPQGLAFDHDGRHVLVGVHRYRSENASPAGAVEVWRIATEGRPALVATQRRIRLPPGVHSIATQ
ncbi:6-phosphogluconolactonase, cycloisomerase 2 family [Rhizobium mongolense subsp. loessense]|uniref:6-phosphogluconolactonase, cycloisomerase 2 family n=1 Tax=Rhizobium mongolense subsp. loessense TaxID=158890 RepID=A0A1G4S976_9HYPH|nr:beta-propeller fold lactonase family protein [Rhizobium mongolense]SCW65762.1 6-phosphogluconolactonase, cycloisomerase 2 family [Rhizobium mongolense subsp. loessense]